MDLTNSLAKTIYLAHLDPEGKRAPQLLLDHLRQVSRLACQGRVQFDPFGRLKVTQ